VDLLEGEDEIVRSLEVLCGVVAEEGGEVGGGLCREFARPALQVLLIADPAASSSPYRISRAAFRRKFRD
jgi:hypothetical protein